MSNATVEIGIPAYNNADYITETISGCLSQDYPAIKVIVADDQSTDATPAISQSYTQDQRVVFFRNEKNLGRVGNYHHLLYEYARSDWYINLDGDDYFIDPHFISHAMKQINRFAAGEIAFYQGNHDVEKLKQLLPGYTQLNDEDIVVEGKEYFINFPRIRKNTHCATLYNRLKALPINFYSFDCLFADFHSLSRLALTGKVILSSRKVAVWRQHENNESKTLNEKKLQNELASLDEIAVFATKYLTENERRAWLRQMKEYYRMVFIYHNSTFNPGWATIRFIVRHWRFSWLYPRYILKNIVLMMKKSSEEKKKAAIV